MATKRRVTQVRLRDNLSVESVDLIYGRQVDCDCVGLRISGGLIKHAFVRTSLGERTFAPTGDDALRAEVWDRQTRLWRWLQATFYALEERKEQLDV